MKAQVSAINKEEAIEKECITITLMSQLEDTIYLQQQRSAGQDVCGGWADTEHSGCWASTKRRVIKVRHGHGKYSAARYLLDISRILCAGVRLTVSCLTLLSPPRFQLVPAISAEFC